MKNLLMIVGFFVVGMAIGAWGPRSDLRLAREKLRSLEGSTRSTRNESPQAVVPDITRMLNMPQKTTSSAPRPLKPKPETPPAGSIPSSTPDEPTPDRNESFKPEDIKESIEAAHDLWKMREAQARQILIDSLNLTETEITAFEELMTEMNRELAERIETSVASMKDKEMLTTQDGITLVHDITGVMLETYTRMDEVFPDDWQSQMTPDSDLPNFIDPLSALPLMELEDKGMFNGESL